MAVNEARAAGSGAVEKRNYSLVLTSGVSATTASQLVNPTLVLPFLYLALDAPVIIAGMLLPCVTASRLLSEIIAAPFLLRTARAKLFMLLTAILSGAALATLAITAQGAEQYIVVALFLAAAVVLGFSQGVTNIGVNQIYGAVVPPSHRSKIFFTQAAASGLLVIVVVWLTKDLLADDTSLQRHIIVLWLGIAATILGGVIIAGVRLLEEEEQRQEDAGAQKVAKAPRHKHQIGVLLELKRGFETGMQYVWFRRYLVMRILTLSVTLAMPFYTIHAVTVHQGATHGLSIFVIAASAGMLAGSLIWGKLAAKSEILVMSGGSFIAGGAAILALLLEMTGLISSLPFYAVVIFLLSFGSHGVINSRSIYLINMTAKTERPYLVAFGDVAAGVLAVGVSAGLGALAHLHSPTAPLVVLLATNIIAGLYIITQLVPDTPSPNRAAELHALPPHRDL